jgi:hypothetical protein
MAGRGTRRRAVASGASAACAHRAGPEAAVARALERGPDVCVTGSLFLVGAVRDGLEARAILR